MAKVNVVDDDSGVLSSLRFLLETEGFDVRTFRDGTTLLNTIEAGDADCYVIDYKMPNISGIDLSKCLRSRDISTPIILITGYPDENISMKAAMAGIRYVLEKPHLEESLVTLVRDAIRNGPAITDSLGETT